MPKKILIIGAGIGQVPLVQKARARGMHVTVATIPGDYPCIDMADDVMYVSVADMDDVVERARAVGFDAVLSDQNDLTGPTSAYVAEKLGLPGNSYDTVMKYCNKNLFTSFCDEVGVPVPRHMKVDETNVATATLDCPLPWIVKPADARSSIAVRRIDSLDQLRPALESAMGRSRTHTAILEEFYTGHEMVCEGFIEDGVYHLLQFADRKYFELPEVFVPNQTLFPSLVDPKTLDEIVGYEQTLARHSNPAFAIVHSEYLTNLATGEVRMVESSLRGGGVYISSHLVPLATGIDINEVIIDKALGNHVDVDAIFAARHDRAAGYACFYLPEGTIASVSGVDEVLDMPFVHMLRLAGIEPGRETEPLTFKGARKGPVLVSGEDRGELEANIETVQSTLRIDVDCPDGKRRGIMWE